MSRASVWAVGPLLLVLAIGCRVALAEEQAVASSTSSQIGGRFGHFISEAAQRFAIPAQWIQSILRMESAGDAHAKSDRGAIGLMQVMPETWAELRLRYALGDDPYDPHDNILAGAAYLRELYDRYGFPGVFAAYNAGPSRYEQHLAGDPLPVETQVYLTNIAAELSASSAAVLSTGLRSWSTSAIFVVRPDRIDVAERRQRGRVSGPAFTATGLHAPSAKFPRSTGIFVARSDAGEKR